jgi:bacterioferritin-associated ferredoxin
MVSSNEISAFVRKHPSSTFKEMVVATGASTGCGRCKNLAEVQFEQFIKKQPDKKQLSIDF